MNRSPFWFVVFISLFTLLSIQSLSQDTTQTYQVCGQVNDETLRKGKDYYVWTNVPKKHRVTRMEGSEGRMVFNFRPDRVRVNRNETVTFSVFPYGRDEESYGRDANNRLSQKRFSQLEEEGKNQLNWDESALGRVETAGDWYAIYQEKSNLISSFKELYVLPVQRESLSSESGNVNIQQVPPTRYYYKTELIYSSNETTTSGISSSYKKLRQISAGKFEFNTTGMAPGFYWITLQGTAVTKGGIPETCPKTTPPVLFEIVDELEIELDPPYQGPVSFQKSGEYTVTANIKGTGPFNLEWKSSNPNGIDVSKCPTYSDKNQVVCNSVKTVPGNLREGERVNISATVTNSSGKVDCNKNNKCSVLIINNVPEIVLSVKDNRSEAINGFPIIIRAKAEDKDVPAQKLTIRDWELYDSEGAFVSIPNDSTKVDNGDNTQTLTINSGLKIGTYKLQARVDDTLDESENNTSFPVVTSGGAGINYFGFANPFPGRDENPDQKPEDWTTDNKPYTEGLYPSREFIDFYTQTDTNPPSIVDSNTNKLESIVKSLIKNPNFKLYIYGYADFKNTKNYSNKKLAQRRINVVIIKLKQIAETLGVDGNRFIDGGIVEIKSYGDSKAKSCENNIWVNERRWDRRVEMIYVYGNDKPKLPIYEPSKCPEN